MVIPKYVQELLGYEGYEGYGKRVYLIHQITDYGRYPGCIAGYLYRIDLKKYKYPLCFKGRIERFVKWCQREYAEAIIHTIRDAGWHTYAIMSITDPVALALEKAGLINKKGR
ncbi:MAG: hypothetical protein AB7D36_09070 [Oscillospiraceae bacterium]